LRRTSELSVVWLGRYEHELFVFLQRCTDDQSVSGFETWMKIKIFGTGMAGI